MPTQDTKARSVRVQVASGKTSRGDMAQPQPPSLAQRLAAETVGTFFLVLAALLSPPGLAMVFVGATLLVLVVTIGKVSGAHVNPAVTVGLMTTRQIKVGEGLLYIVAQILGAFVALGLGNLLERGLPEADPGKGAVWFEMLGTALLVFVVTRTVLQKAPEAASALAIGLSLTVGIAIAGPSSGGVLNPAIAVVLLTGNLFSGSVFSALGYLAAPLLAGALAALLARYLGAEGASASSAEAAEDSSAEAVAS